MADKVPVLMELKVDLQCDCCYKKIKKVLSKFPQITGQIYDEKQNTVRISVVCCSPEKFRDKLCCKCGKVIQRIDIITQPPKQEEQEKKNSSKDNEKEKTPVVVVDKEPIDKTPARTCCGPCSEGHGGGPCYNWYPFYKWYPAPPPCYYRYYGYGHGCGYGCGRGCNLRRSVCYIEDENPSSCKIM